MALLAGCSAPAVPSTATLPEIHLRAVVPSTTTTVDWGPGARYAAAVVANERREAIVRVAHLHPNGTTPIVGAPRPAPTNVGYMAWPDWPLWRCTAFHESGGLFWSNEAGPYAGAFDIARTTWRAFAGQYARRWPDAGTAPAWAQILGARLVRAAVGSSEWGGLRACGG